MKNNVQNGSTLKLTNRKTHVQKHEPELQNANTLVSRYRVKSGADFESEISDLLLSYGLPTKKKSMAVKYGLKKVSDFYYDGKKDKYWIEATTCLANQPRVEELINKKTLVQAEDPTITKWVVFFRKNPKQATKSKSSINRYRKQFEMNGITFCNGDSEINEYISSILSNEGIATKVSIRVATVMMIPLSRIIYNANNREVPDKNVTILMNYIVAEGFVTQINVVPESIDGKLTGNYIAFEGHTRLRALNELVKMGHRFDTGVDDPLIPCVVCNWLTSEDKAIVARLLCHTNTTSRPWEMKNYIIFHHKTSAPTYVNNEQKHYSYGVLKWLRSNEARQTYLSKNGSPVLFGENLLIYIFGPKKSETSSSKFLNTSVINEGDYRTTENEFKMMKRFLNKIILPFHEWFSTDEYFDNMTLRRFMSTLYEWYKSGDYSIDDISFFTDYFKSMSNPPVKESEISDEFWNELGEAFQKRTSVTKKTRSKNYIANPV